MDRLEEIRKNNEVEDPLDIELIAACSDRRWLLGEVDAQREELGRLRAALEALVGALGLRKSESELIEDYGMLGLDAVQRARRALAGEE